jgi:hypothetical protein
VFLTESGIAVLILKKSSTARHTAYKLRQSR